MAQKGSLLIAIHWSQKPLTVGNNTRKTSSGWPYLLHKQRAVASCNQRHSEVPRCPVRLSILFVWSGQEIRQGPVPPQYSLPWQVALLIGYLEKQTILRTKWKVHSEGQEICEKPPQGRMEISGWGLIWRVVRLIRLEKSRGSPNSPLGAGLPQIVQKIKVSGKLRPEFHNM